MLEVDVCLKTSLNNLSVFSVSVCVCEAMRDQKVIKIKDGVDVCVYASCFPLFSLGIFCVSGCESKETVLFWRKQQKHLLVLETTDYNHVYLQLE